MTDAERLKAHVKLILDQVRPDTRFYGYRDPESAIAQEPIRPIRGNEPPVIAAHGDVAMIHEQVVALRTLYSQSPQTLQKDFAVLLMSLSSAKSAAVVVHVMVEIGALTTLLVGLTKRVKGKDEAFERRSMWEALRAKLAHESHRFTDADLTLIANACEQQDALARIAAGEKVGNLPPRLR